MECGNEWKRHHNDPCDDKLAQDDERQQPYGVCGTGGENIRDEQQRESKTPVTNKPTKP